MPCHPSFHAGDAEQVMKRGKGAVLLELPSCCLAEHPGTPSGSRRLCVLYHLVCSRQVRAHGVENALPDSEAYYNDAGCTK